MERGLGTVSRGGTRGTVRHITKRVSAILLATGFVALIIGLAVMFASLAPLFVQRSDPATVAAPLEAPTLPDTGPSTATEPSPLIPPGLQAKTVAFPAPVDGYSFELQIPVIGYRAMVHQGVSLAVLAHSPGHYPTTPWPGQPGNVGIAAHNVYWLSFNRLKAGDQVELRTEHGLYVYEITGSRVVNPDDRTVLAPTSTSMLTMTTCWPLWAGAFATQRLVFTARPLGGVS